MLMVKADEKNGIFRGHMSILQQYNQAYELPEVRELNRMWLGQTEDVTSHSLCTSFSFRAVLQELELGMIQHLELHYLGDQITSDEKLLTTYPAAIRRKILRWVPCSGIMTSKSF